MSPGLICALDLPSDDATYAMAKLLVDDVDVFKIGLEGYLRYGSTLVDRIASLGRPIFLDLKLHDIPRTVAASVMQLREMGVRMLTVHAAGGEAMVRAAVEADPALDIFAVTVLTSLDQSALQAIGLPFGPAQWVPNLARSALGAGAAGVVCSGRELLSLSTLGGLRVVPGVRFAGEDTQDQARVVTPFQAAKLGASYVVVGRPIVQAKAPKEAATAIRRALESEAE